MYAVSRWGRFQDADESAYYEYICRRAGIEVRYCAEQFENDGSPVSTIVKGQARDGGRIQSRAIGQGFRRSVSAHAFQHLLVGDSARAALNDALCRVEQVPRDDWLERAIGTDPGRERRQQEHGWHNGMRR